MRHFVLSLTLLALGSCSPGTTASDTAEYFGRIENNLLEFQSPSAMLHPDSLQIANPKTLAERMAFYHTPGVSLAAIEPGGAEFAKAYGTADVETGAPVTTETIFQAASTSKLVTAVLALQFVERGDIDLDTDVNDYLKSWRVKDNEYTATRKVTLRGLLTHMAGMPSTNFGQQEGARYPTLLDVLNGEPPALNAAAVPVLEPGTEWQYSNIGYDVIQVLLEDVSGKPFDQIARELVFSPLGMNSSSFAYPLDEQMQSREARPHDAEGVARKPLLHRTALAHGNLTTTPGDLAKFMKELLLSYRGESELILRSEMTRKLMARELDLDPGMFGMPISEGLGVLLVGSGDDLAFAHPGSNLPGLNCWLIGWPEKQRGIVVMTNGASGEMLAMETISAFQALE